MVIKFIIILNLLTKEMKILIADDNKDFCSTMAEIVDSFNYETVTFNDPESTINYIANNNNKIALLLLDIEFGPGEEKNGLDILDYSRKNYPQIPAIMISGKGTIETAVKATKLGASNFIEKSVISKDKILEVINSVIGLSDSDNVEAQEIQKFLQMNGIIGSSKSMIELGDNIIRFGRTELNVLVTGETGTGKKLVAKAIHNISRRSRQPFVTVDIPNIPSELFQSELFGHVKGSFSGAVDNKKGLFHQANKGSLFLDEIGDLPLELQSNLLLPIEDKSIRRVGSVDTEPVDIRFISATDKELINAIKDNKYREQLYHRLRECEIHLPPLRERTEDIPDIVDYYLMSHNDMFSEQKVFSPSALEYLCEQEWSGNIRELISSLKLSLQTIQKEVIEVSDLHKILQLETKKKVQRTHSLNDVRTLKEDLEEVDKKKVEATLSITNGNVSKAAAKLGVSRETLHSKIRKYEIDVNHFRQRKSK